MPTSLQLKNTAPTQRLQPHTSNVTSCVFHTRWGWMGLSASPRGIRCVILPQTSRTRVVHELGQGRLPTQRHPSAALAAARRQIEAFLRGRRRDFALPLDLAESTPFQRQVWRATLGVPYGKLRSYRWIAGRVGDAHSARAVGNALGANPIPLLIPCHRVVTADASLGGFSCGLAMKRRLLALEGSLDQLKS